jgi:pimeloyl-ACP methyl ester carboxylesterase
MQDISLKKVHVGDIDVAYKMFGNGEPLILFNGASDNMDAWDPSLLKVLSSNHTVIVSDQRGIANTTAGSKPYTPGQLANELACLMLLKYQMQMLCPWIVYSSTSYIDVSR